MSEHQQQHQETQKKTTTTVAQQEQPLVTPGQAYSALPRASIDSSRLTAGDVMALQRTVGNHAVARLLGRDGPRPQNMPLVQAKLAVGPVGDKYEQEADRVAKEVVAMPGTAQRQVAREGVHQGVLRKALDRRNIVALGAGRDTIQRVAISTVEEQPIFTKNHRAKSVPDALAKFKAAQRDRFTTYVGTGVNLNINQTDDSDRVTRGSASDTAWTAVDPVYAVTPLTNASNGATHKVTQKTGSRVQVKGNVKPVTRGRGYKFMITGINRSAGGSVTSTTTYPQAPAAPRQPAAPVAAQAPAPARPVVSAWGRPPGSTAPPPVAENAASAPKDEVED